MNAYTVNSVDIIPLEGKVHVHHWYLVLRTCTFISTLVLKKYIMKLTYKCESFITIRTHFSEKTKQNWYHISLYVFKKVILKFLLIRHTEFLLSLLDEKHFR